MVQQTWIILDPLDRLDQTNSKYGTVIMWDMPQGRHFEMPMVIFASIFFWAVIGDVYMTDVFQMDVT